MTMQALSEMPSLQRLSIRAPSRCPFPQLIQCCYIQELLLDTPIDAATLLQMVQQMKMLAVLVITSTNSKYTEHKQVVSNLKCRIHTLIWNHPDEAACLHVLKATTGTLRRCALAVGPTSLTNILEVFLSSASHLLRSLSQSCLSTS